MNKFTEQALRGEPNDLRNLQPTPSPTHQEPLALPVTVNRLPNGSYEAMDEHGLSLGVYTKKRANYIANAVNSHSALLAACEAALLDYDGGTLTVSRREQLRAALALAGKGEERG